MPREDEKSRSQVKREFRELKELSVELAALSTGQLRAMPLSDKTRDALLAAKEMSRGPLQRQHRYISSLLAEEDVAALREALDRAQRPHALEVAAQHAAERWRDRLLSADEAGLAALVARFPQQERTQILQLVHDAKREHDLGKPPRSARQLFRFLRQLPSLPQVEHQKLRP